MADEIPVEPSESEGGLNQKLDFPFLLLYQMQKITQKFSEGSIQGGIFIIKLMESSYSFKEEDGWKIKIKALDEEFEGKFTEVNNEKVSMYQDVREKAKSNEFLMLTDYWLRRFDILMCLPKMKNMLYKETETGIIK